MKKYILSPLCSAVVLPGLGQVLNKRILKGFIIMALVFVIFIALTVKLALVIIAEMKMGDMEGLNKLLENKLPVDDLSGMWGMIILFIAIWLYSIVDAFIDGMKIERSLKEKPDEILPHR